MIAKSNISYGAQKPEEVIYAETHVYVNVGLHAVEVRREGEEPTIDWVATEMYEYTYPEYTELQDIEVKLAEDRAVTTAFEATLELIGGN